MQEPSSSRDPSDASRGAGQGTRRADPDRARRPRRPSGPASSRHGPAGEPAAGRAGRGRPARSTASCRSTRSGRTPKQPRQVFDEDAQEELKTSIKEFGLLQPVVVRETGPGCVRAGDGRAAVAGQPRPRPADDPGDRPGHRRRRDAARRAAGEPAPGPAEPAGRGGGVPAAARGVRHHARGAGQPDRPQPVRRSPTRSGCSTCRCRCSAGSPPACCRPGMPGRCSPWTTPRRRTRWPPGSWPRGCRCGRSRSWSRSPGTRSRPPARPAPARRVSAPALTDLADRLSDNFDTRVKVELGRRKGKIVVEFASVDDLERIVGLMVPGMAPRSGSTGE